MLKPAVLILLLTLQISCSAKPNEFNVEQLTLIQDVNLAKSLNEYYLGESKKDWNKTYELRSRVFVETVSFDFYYSMMEKNAVGWSFLRAVVVDVDLISQNEHDVYIEFYSIRNGQNHRFTQRTNWLKENGLWKSNIPGKRGLFLLNDWVKQ